MKVQITKLKNVYDKEQLYLIIGEPENRVVINIGTKTYEALNKIINPQNEQKPKKEDKK